jgi:hypothetical protein
VATKKELNKAHRTITACAQWVDDFNELAEPIFAKREELSNTSLDQYWAAEDAGYCERAGASFYTMHGYYLMPQSLFIHLEIDGCSKTGMRAETLDKQELKKMAKPEVYEYFFQHETDPATK